jgi:RecB family endonuclease NucS
VAYIAARNKYVIKREDVGAIGRADFSFYPLLKSDTAFVIELKKNDSTENALKQIKENKYFLHFKNFTGRKLLVGISYDVNTKKHSVKIERLD